jgi:hypothetical protein
VSAFEDAQHAQSQPKSILNVFGHINNLERENAEDAQDAQRLDLEEVDLRVD